MPPSDSAHSGGARAGVLAVEVKTASQDHKNTMKEIVRYCLVTPFVGLVDFGTYYGAQHVMPLAAAKALSFAAAAVTGYLLNKHVTFAKHRSSPAEAARYLVIQFSLLAFNVATNHAALLLSSGRVWESMLTASLLTAVLSFICKKWWVFR